MAKDPPADLTDRYALSDKDWRKAQSADPQISRMIDLIKSGAQPSAPQVGSDTVDIDRRYLKIWDQLVLHNGVLFRKTNFQDEEIRQLVLPNLLHRDIFAALHDDLGHQGRDRTLALFKQRFYWPGMETFVRSMVKACSRCLLRKTAPTRSAELVPIVSSAPLELVCVDYLSLERSKGGFENILVITDHFTRYAQAIPTRNQTARTTARMLFESFIVHYGFPATIHSDRGANFESRLIQELCDIAGIQKSRTTPYHPMGNGMVERFNQTLLKMLGTLEEHEKSDWKAHVPTLVHAYNCTEHDSTGYSPYFLMFGRHPRLAIDAFLGLRADSVSATNTSDYVRKLQDRLGLAYDKARQEARHSSGKQKQAYDRRVRHSTLKPGDIVLVRNVGIRGKQKLADRWESKPYVIKRQPIPDIPVYEVILEHGRSRKVRTLHRNLLLPFMCVTSLTEQQPKDAIRNRHPPSPPGSKTSVGIEEDGDERPRSSDTRSYIIPMRRKNGGRGLQPRSISPADDGGQSGSESSSDSADSDVDHNVNQRPRRQSKRPAWMDKGDWVLQQAQEHVFTVPKDQVVCVKVMALSSQISGYNLPVPIGCYKVIGPIYSADFDTVLGYFSTQISMSHALLSYIDEMILWVGLPLLTLIRRPGRVVP